MVEADREAQEQKQTPELTDEDCPQEDGAGTRQGTRVPGVLLADNYVDDARCWKRVMVPGTRFHKEEGVFKVTEEESLAWLQPGGEEDHNRVWDL